MVVAYQDAKSRVSTQEDSDLSQWPSVEHSKLIAQQTHRLKGGVINYCDTFKEDIVYNVRRERRVFGAIST